MTQSSVGWLLFLLITSTPMIGAAAEEAPSGVSSEAMVHFERGVELYRESNLDAALAEFVRANELSPSYHLLYNMAQVQAERHDYVHAVELLDAYLEQGGEQVPTARRAQVEEELARLQQRIATLWVSVDVDKGTLWVNDEVVATLPLKEPVLLNAGIARIRIEAAGRKTFVKEIGIAGGDKPRLSLSLESLPDTAPASPRDAELESGRSPLVSVGLVVGALGIAGIGVGAGFGVSVLDQSDTARQLCDGNLCTSERGVDAAKTAATHATIATIGFTAGSALLATGVMLWILGAQNSPENAERVDAGLRVAPLAGSSDLGMALSGKW
jgi:tetratricopeptide (TPR) repeat protein